MKLTTTHIMYGALWAMLIVQITIMMNTSACSILTQAVSKETGRIIADNGMIVSKYGQFAAGISNREYTQPAYHRMLNVRHRVAAELYSLDSIIHLITAETGYNASLASKHLENRKWRKIVFPEKAAIFRIMGGIDTLNEFLIRNVDFRWSDSRTYLRRYLPSKWGDEGWEEQERYRAETVAMLYKSNAAAAIAILTAFKLNIVLSEKLILDELYQDGRRGCYFAFSAIIALAVPNKIFAVPGEVISGNIFTANYDRYPPIRVSCTEGRVTGVTNGIATWKGIAKGIGLHRVSGKITRTTDTGVQIVPWKIQYRVTPAYASLQLDKMSYIYRGIQNPVTIQCAASYDVRDMSLYIPGAEVSATDAGGKYFIRVKSRAARRLTAMIIYKNKNSSADTIGGLTFSVKDLPLPVAGIGNVIRRTITAAELAREDRISAINPDDDAELTYTIVGYTFSFLKKGGNEISGPISISGAAFTDHAEVQAFLRNASKGDRVFFEDIKAASPDGSIVSPAPVCYLLE